MAAMTVYGKLLGPGAAALAQSALTVALVDYNNEPVGGFDSVDQTEILSSLPVAVNADGTWTVQLLPNAQLRLAGGTAATAWRITEGGAGAAFTYWIIVVAGNPAVPVWAGNLVTTLVGGAAYPTPVNLAVAGNLTVAGALTYDGVTIAAPPNDPLKFLNGAGAFTVPGGGPPSGTASGDLGGTYPGPLLGDTAHVHTIIDARIPAALPPNGAAGGDLSSVYPNPTVAKVRGVAISGTPAAGNLLTATSSTTATWSAPAAARDPYTAMLGLVGQPFPLDANDHDDLGVTAGFLICALIRPGAGPVTNLGLWLSAAGGTSTGVSSMALFSESGTQLGVTGDMTAALTNGVNAGTYIEAALTSPYTAADATDYYVGILCQLTTNAKIAGVFGTSNTLHIPAVKGNRPMIVVGGQSTMPTTIDVAGATTAGAAYWLVAS